MTDNEELLTNLQPCNLKVPSMPKLENVIPGNGLKVNVININQLCDHNLFIQFTKHKCLVTNSTNAHVMEGKDYQTISIC